MIKTIQLHGALANKYTADPIQLDADTPHMVTSGLICMFGPEFKKDIREGWFEFLCTDTENGTKEYIHDKLTAGKVVDCDHIDFTPVLQGSGRFGQIIAGVVLIVVGLTMTVGTAGALSPLGQGFVSAGIAMVLGGVIQLIMAVPTADSLERERPENMPSFVFNGAVNVYEQGGPVPLVYGRIRAGSVVVSAGFAVEQIPYNQNCNAGGPPRRRGPGCRGPRRSGK